MKALPVDGLITALDLEQMFHGDPTLKSVLTSVTSRPGRVGLLTRADFFEAMTGRLGYGRLIHARQSVARLAAWDPLTLPHDATLETVSTVVLERPDASRARDVVVSWPDGSFGTASVASIFEALAITYGYEATHDRLTGLPNRTLLMDRLSVMLQHSERAESQVAVLFCDLDGFKRINDSLGHQIGDEILIEAGRRFATVMRREDTLSRVGGDEFVVACELEGQFGPELLAERLIGSLTMPLAVRGYQVRIATSIGIALANGSAVTPDDMVRNADLAMYRAKTERRAGFAIFDSSMHDRAVERLNLEQSLAPALERGEFSLHYQPLVATADRRLLGFEALVRWQVPGGRLIPPGAFIGIAEDTGFIMPLGGWVVSEACRQLAAWRSDGAAKFTVGVNVSARQLSDPGLMRHVTSALDSYGLSPGALVLEITESALIEDVESSLGVLAALHSLGIAISVDDFGTGQSSLSYLAEIPLNSLKIDKSFIDGLETSERSRTLTSTVISLAHNLGVRSVAEGVERESQLTILEEMGCDVVQGFYIGRPEPPARIAETWLAERGYPVSASSRLRARARAARSAGPTLGN
ncbi:MAG TPA: EAL domain-containing protein [Candidatus Dormibacteraeota bacterium]|nr:EAL domain-containing protein [Candidatus Dormibacteraeota bacterium]